MDAGFTEEGARSEGRMRDERTDTHTSSASSVRAEQFVLHKNRNTGTEPQESLVAKLLMRHATVVAQCRAEPQTKKQQQILSFVRYTRYVTVSGHAQDIWVPPATCTKWGHNNYAWTTVYQK